MHREQQQHDRESIKELIAAANALCVDSAQGLSINYYANYTMQDKIVLEVMKRGSCIWRSEAIDYNTAGSIVSLILVLDV